MSKDNLIIDPIFSELDVSATFVGHAYVAEKRAKGEKVFHFGIGESPFPVPKRLKNALIEHADKKSYLPSPGLPELQDVAMDYYKDEIDINPDDYDVLIAPGSKILLYVSQMAVQGDLIFLVPSWLTYGPQAKLLKTNVIKVPVDIDGDSYHIDMDTFDQHIQEARKQGLNPRKMILNYPNNPTSLRITEEDLRAIGEYCEKEGILIIADEIYCKIDFTDQKYHSIAKFAPNNSIITTGISKHLSLAGWRIGIAFVPKSFPGLFKAMCTIASETWSCVPAPLQYAVIDAFKRHDDVEQHITDCKEVHKTVTSYLCERLINMGIGCTKAQAGFYTYVDFSAHRQALEKMGITTSTEIANYLLHEYNIVVLSGTEFGGKEEDLTLRMSCRDYDGEKALKTYISENRQILDPNTFANEIAPNICEALGLIEGFITKLSSVDTQKAAL